MFAHESTTLCTVKLMSNMCRSFSRVPHVYPYHDLSILVVVNRDKTCSSHSTGFQGVGRVRGLQGVLSRNHIKCSFHRAFLGFVERR